MAVIFTSSSSLSLPPPMLSTATTTTTTLFSSNDSISGNRPTSIISKTLLSSPVKPINRFTEFAGSYGKWRTRVSFFPSFSKKAEDTEALKEELFGAIAPLDRGAEATAEDQKRIDQIARKIEAKNKVKEPLKSDLLNGKWELLYTTSQSILQTQRPKLLRPNGKIYQAINGDTLRAQNLETWPFFNQATANLVPLDSRRVAVKFDSFKIAGLIPIKARGSGRGQLEITYLDDELRISRGNQGNLFVLRMADPSYRVPLS